MIDLVKLLLRAGNGGNGRVAFRREKHVPKGGPNGGNGGNGGNIILRPNPHLTTLQHLSHVHQIEAAAGKAGGKQLSTGQSAEDVIVEVPVGTVVWLVAENQASRKRRRKYGVNWRLPKAEADFRKYHLVKESDPVPAEESDELRPIDPDVESKYHDDLELGAPTVDHSPDTSHQFTQPTMQLLEITAETEDIILCQGGFGGRGNDRFKSSTNTTPLEAEYGTFGEQKLVYLEQKLLADIGLVGFPNAGKSTLLSRLTNARPKIANYPFTTLEPQLGILTLGKGQERREVVVADIPGLIEGAHQGKGLGFTFLRHIEHCQLLAYVVALPDEVVIDPDIAAADKADALFQQLETLQSEIRSHSSALFIKKHILIVNKLDIYTTDVIDEVKQRLMRKDQMLFLVSAVTGQGLDSLTEFLARELR